MKPVTTRSGTVVGDVHHRVGEGPKLKIPHGPVTIATTAAEAVLSWERDDVRGAGTLTLAEFEHYVDEGSIRLDR